MKAAAALFGMAGLASLGSAQTVPGFTRVALHHIPGHDEAGIIVLSHEHVQGLDGCAQACTDVRGCNSFEYGVTGGGSDGDCLLSFDTRTTIPVNTFAVSAAWDYHERDQPVDPLSLYTRTAESWLPGVNDVASYEQVTEAACAQLCFQHAECRSFEHSYNGPACLDSAHSGFNLRAPNGSTVEAPCAQLGQIGACSHAEYAERISARCPLTCGRCPPERAMCQLAYYAAGDVHPDGSTVAVAAMENWTLFTRPELGVLAGCPPGTASFTGETVDDSGVCPACPANTYSGATHTACVMCPEDYASPPLSSSIHDCARVLPVAGNGTGFFHEGDLWVGNYNCGAAFSGQGNGKLELLVAEVSASGAVTFIRRFQNSFSRGSYYMTLPGGAPGLNESVTLTAGGWIDRPANSTSFNGTTRYTVQTDLTGTVTDDLGSLRFTGNICDGAFGLSQACAATPNATFTVGEQWIGEYRCQDSVESDRTDVRRLDLTIAEVNDSHVRVVNHFFHQDGAGSFHLEGDFNNETHRLHLATNGADAWIRRPSLNWYTSDLNGAVTDDKLLFFGTKGGDPSCGCSGEMETITALDVVSQAMATRQVGGVCQGYEPVPCEPPFNQLATTCWATRRPWCYTGDDCPNGVVHASTTGRQAVSCLVQQCSRFQTHRICSPLDSQLHCDCTGNTDTEGRGGTCASYPDDSRGNWCYVSSRCVWAGPADNATAPGMYWSSCDPVQPCLTEAWADWGRCLIPACSVDGAEIPGNKTRSRGVLRPAANGGTPCGALSETVPCTGICNYNYTDSPAVPLTLMPSPTPTSAPSASPSPAPTTAGPTAAPAISSPTAAPAISSPTAGPSPDPTSLPSVLPTSLPSTLPSGATSTSSPPAIQLTTMIPTVSICPLEDIGACAPATTCIGTVSGSACFCGDGTAVLVSTGGDCAASGAPGPVCDLVPCAADQLCVANGTLQFGFACESRGRLTTVLPAGVSASDPNRDAIRTSVEGLLAAAATGAGRRTRRASALGTVVVTFAAEGPDITIDVPADSVDTVSAALGACELCFSPSEGGAAVAPACLSAVGAAPCPVDGSSPLGSSSDEGEDSAMGGGTVQIVVAVCVLLLLILLGVGYLAKRMWATAKADAHAVPAFDNPLYDTAGNENDGLYATIAARPPAQFADQGYQEVGPGDGTAGLSNPLYGQGHGGAGYMDVNPAPHVGMGYLDVTPDAAGPGQQAEMYDTATGGGYHSHGDPIYHSAHSDPIYLDTKPLPPGVEVTLPMSMGGGDVDDGDGDGDGYLDVGGEDMYGSPTEIDRLYDTAVATRPGNAVAYNNDAAGAPAVYDTAGNDRAYDIAGPSNVGVDVDI